MCIYICVCVCVCVCIYIYIYTRYSFVLVNGFLCRQNSPEGTYSKIRFLAGRLFLGEIWRLRNRRASNLHCAMGR